MSSKFPKIKVRTNLVSSLKVAKIDKKMVNITKLIIKESS